ncbi:glycosyltransferase [Pelagibacterium sp. H642]|uniref:glycosyltransferase n=1 Tax=Pelagibacterium sp. H642 TaxID=1881069 RepID=UPI00281695E5|nr:glycosyltransferase [Pelagibacterium sp. H642]WMT92616.1 glycosyltransferase [Pelagibacterium sp. H642]
MYIDDYLGIALLLDPRFPGGTSSAVAQEIQTLHPRVRLKVHGLETRMFKGRAVNNSLAQALNETGIELQLGGGVVRAPVVVIHNPSCLKFDQCCNHRIVCDTLIVVTHENFTRPDGSESFDVSHCLDLIEQSTICRARRLCPVSQYNRDNVAGWVSRSGSKWKLAPFDWFNICDFDIVAPVAAPADRRGRHSRAGFEKFPPLEVMKRHFPPSATCRILGGDSFLLDPGTVPAHWDVLPFGTVPVPEFLQSIDFFVYFTHPLLRESFGRVLAEAICAGKLVITDHDTAMNFCGAVHPSDGTDLDRIIAGYVADPPAYQQFVEQAQKIIRRFGPDRFAETVLAGIDGIRRGDDALL